MKSSLLFILMLLLDDHECLLLQPAYCSYKRDEIAECDVTSITRHTFDNVHSEIRGLFVTCKSTEISKLTADEFNKFHQLTTLHIVNCNLAHIEDGAFQGLDKLTYLEIYGGHNDRINIRENAFNSTPTLSYIKLSMGIRRLANSMFCKLQNFVILNLSSNNIVDLDDIGCGKDSCCKSMTMLYIKYNGLKEVKRKQLQFPKIIELDLSSNRIEHLEEGCFDNLKMLFQIKLSKNRLTTIDRTLFNNNKFLQDIDLSFNQLMSLPYFPRSTQDLNLDDNQLIFNNSFSDTFVGLDALRTLRLSHNLIEYLPSGIFDSVTSLLYLNLSNNLLKQLTCSDFMFLERLGILDLTSNEIANIPESVFKNCSSLEYLHLGRNQISEFNFSEVSHLRTLNLSCNQLTNISNLQTMKYLENLDLSFNNIDYIDENAFKQLHESTNLYVGGNNIEIIQPGTFENFERLRYLYLQSNNLKTFKAYNSGIRHLFLQDNQIESFDFDDSWFRLILINLANNRLRSFIISDKHLLKNCKLEILIANNNQLHDFNDLLDLPKIKEIELRNNTISTLGRFSNRVSSTLELVDLRNNSISEISYEDIDKRSFITIDIRNNPVDCTCRNDWLAFEVSTDLYYQLTKIRRDAYCQIIYPRQRRFSSRLKMLKENQKNMLCKDNENCPSQCVCFYNFNVGVYILDCLSMSWDKELPMLPSNSTIIYFDNNTNLASFVGDLLINSSMLQILYMNNSGLISLDKNMFQGTPNLKELHLEGNQLSEISENFFNSTRYLKKLYLHQNSLQFLSPKAFEDFQLTLLTLHDNKLVQPQLWTFELRVLEISLGGNPFDCDCYFVIQFQQWVSKSHDIKVNDLNNLICAGSTIPIMHFDQAECFDTINIEILVPILSISAFFILLAVLIHFYRVEMKVWLYAKHGFRFFYDRNNQIEDDGKIFHAFISYANEDDEWIAQTLVPRLTEYKFCIHQRDFPVGSQIIDSIVKAVENSCRTVIVLTPNFLQSHWCLFEFETAHVKSLQDRCQRIIMIILEDVDQDQMSPNMSAYMKTNTYLHRNDRMFWSKLKYALPDLTKPLNQTVTHL